MTHAIYAQHGEALERFGPAGRQRCRQDILHHLDYLEAAAEVNDSTPFVWYVLWLKEVLGGRGVPAAHLAFSLQLIASFLVESLPHEVSARLQTILDAAQASLADPQALAHFGLTRLPALPQTPRYQLSILQGNRNQALASVVEAMDAGATLPEACVQIVQPALYEVGNLWQKNRITVAQEHLASAISQNVLVGAYLKASFLAPTGKSAVFACVEGNHHGLGLRMLSDAFETRGWDAAFLGTDVPTLALIKDIDARRPQLLALSVSLPQHLALVRQTVDILRAELGAACPPSGWADWPRCRHLTCGVTPRQTVGHLTPCTRWNNSEPAPFSPPMRHLIELTLPKLDCLPSCLAQLGSVVVALIAENGQLIHSNLGFLRLTRHNKISVGNQPDVRGFFANPSFDELLAIHASPGQSVFEGILNVVDEHSACHSLIGSVHHIDRKLMIVAEYDVAEMERLNAEVIQLNLELAELQRSLSRTNRNLQASEERLKQLSITDSLTGLANRRHLMDFLQQAWQSSQRFTSTFSVIVADIDLFKKVNDQFGHEQGDVVLKAVAAQMQAMVRKVDLVARLGGEEFVVVLQEASLSAAVELAQRLRQAVAELPFAAMPHGVTCSYGVAQLTSGQTAEQLLKQADGALYQSKHDGRNRVTAHPLIQ